jgi:hypothetical protein
MSDVGRAIGVADCVATSYVESGLEAAGEIITKYKSYTLAILYLSNIYFLDY